MRKRLSTEKVNIERKGENVVVRIVKDEEEGGKHCRQREKDGEEGSQSCTEDDNTNSKEENVCRF